VKPVLRACLILSFLLCLSPCCRAEAQEGARFGPAGYSLSEAVFLPPRFYVGDRVELRLRLETAPGVSLEPVALEAEKEWLSVEEVRVQSPKAGEAEVRIYFVSFYPGTTHLPPLRLGDLLLGDITITTLSALEKEDASRLRGPRGQLALPGTYLKLASLLLAVLALPGAGIFLGRRLLRAARKLRRLRQWRRPYLRARRELRILEQGLAGSESRGFFIRLSRLLKAYLSERLALPVLSRTTGELAASSPGLHPGDWAEVMEVLKLADLAKFSRQESSKAEMTGTLARVSALIERLEKESSDVES